MRTPGFQITNWAAALLAVAVYNQAFADTVFLKSGEKIDGRVTGETATDYTIEYHVSASITDTRSVSKADVAKIDKEAPDEKVYQGVKNLKLGPNSLPPASYDMVIGNLQGFLNMYPKSAHLAEIQSNLDAIRAEKQRVDGGELKIDNRWINKEEAQKERIQLMGLAQFRYMTDQARRGDFVGALNAFAQLEKTAAGSASYPDAVDLAKQIVPNLKSSADRAAQTWKYQKAERDKGIQLLSGNEKAETIAADQREQKQADAALDAATKAGVAFPPMLMNSEKALSTIASKAVELEKRLSTIPVAKMRQSIGLAKSAREEIENANFADAGDHLKQAQALWNANEMASRLNTELTSAKSKASAAPAVAPEAPKPAAAPRATPAPAAAAPAPAPVAEHKGGFPGAGVVVAIVAIVGILGAITIYKRGAAREHEAVQ